MFLLAAHIALGRFSPLLSSEDFAAEIRSLTATHQIAPDTRVLMYGDQAYGSSIPFYLGRQVTLVDGRSTSMLFGSTFPDAPPVFWTAAQLRSAWAGAPARLILSVPAEHRDDVDRLLAGLPTYPLRETAGKLLLTNRPLDRAGERVSLEQRPANL